MQHHLHETIFTIVFYHPFEQRRLSFNLIIGQEKMSTCPSKYPMNHTACNLFQRSHTKKEWDLERKQFIRHNRITTFGTSSDYVNMFGEKRDNDN